MISGSSSFNVDLGAAPKVFHGFAENRVVHELEEVGLKVRLGLGAQVRVQLDVWGHPSLLFEPKASVNLCTASDPSRR